MRKENDNYSSDKFLSNFIFFNIVLTLLAIGFPFLINFAFDDWAKSGTFGDTYGALNALFSGLAFSGVIVTILIQKTELKNQRLELSLQRIEMQETRKEFLLNRTTNLVYSQLERFEKALNDFSLSHDGVVYHGNDAILFLRENEENVFKPLDMSEENFNFEMKAATIKLLKTYCQNKTEIEKLAHNTFNTVEVLKRLIYKTNLEIEELADIKNLFFVNVGFINMGVLEYISKITGSQLKYLKTEDYVNNNLDYGIMINANIFLKSIIEFYNLKLNDKNFEEEKANWLEGIGIVK